MFLKSNKTTVAGAAAGLALVLSAFEGEFEWKKATLKIVAGLGLMAFGWYARDDNITSEGTIAAKTPKAVPSAETPATPPT